jgi:tetratricopeptide (TPR) repeat protein
MDDADTLVRRAASRLARENWAGAEEDLVAAQAKGHDDADLQLLLGMARRGLKKYAAAERAFAAALAQVPAHPGYLLQHGLTLLYRGKMAGAERDFDAVLAQQPNDAEAHRNRALARYGQGNSAGAVEDYSAALRGSTDTSLLTGRVHALLRLGRVREAEADCEAVLRAGPDSPDALGCQGALLLARGDFDGASARYDDARQKANGTDWHFQLGLSLLLGGRAADALTACRRGAEELVPGDFQTALSDLDFWMDRFPGCVANPDLQQAASGIRLELTRRLKLEQEIE